MVHGLHNQSSLPLNVISTNSSSSTSRSSSTTTQFINILNPNTSNSGGGQELTQVQHYNDLQSLRSNLKNIKDINLKRDDKQHQIDSWMKSAKSTSPSRKKLCHQANINDSFYIETSFVNENKNLNTDNLEQENKIQNTDVQQQEVPLPSRFSGRARSWWKGRLGSSRTSSATSSSTRGRSFKRTRLWSSISRTFDLSERQRKEDKKVNTNVSEIDIKITICFVEIKNSSLQ